MTDRCGNDLGVDALCVEDLADLGNEVKSVFADVVHTADEGSNIGSACVGGKNGLAGGENNGIADGDTLGRKGLNGLKSFGDHGDLDNDVLALCGKLSAFFDHSLGVNAENLGKNRAVGNDCGDVGEKIVKLSVFS